MLIDKVLYLYEGDKQDIKELYIRSNDELMSIDKLNANDLLKCKYSKEKFIGLKEGVFTWNTIIKDFSFFANFDKLTRKKEVLILEGFAYSFDENTRILFEEGETYLVDGEYITYIDNYQQVMLAVHKFGFIPVAIPYMEERMVIVEADFIDIGFVKLECDCDA